MRDAISEGEVVKIAEGERLSASDVFAVEEPCEIRLGDEAVAVTMRTPGHDAELAAGFLFTEGIIDARDVASITHCSEPDALHAENVVEVRLAPGRQPLRGWQRHFFATSSCGICGKASIESIHVDAAPVDAIYRVSPASLTLMVDRLGRGQEVFATTGGLHAAGLFSSDAAPLVIREDIGRHNAVDKVIGHALMHELLPLDRYVLVVSGRTSFEIVQKALVARIPVVAGVSAASSLAVDLAAQSNMTLVGFLRGSGMNVYAGADRVA